METKFWEKIIKKSFKLMFKDNFLCEDLKTIQPLFTELKGKNHICCYGIVIIIYNFLSVFSNVLLKN